MRFIRRKETDPYFNIAAEEFLLKNATQDTFSLYINDPCIVIGKHQNYAREINHHFVMDKGLLVIRRITGGGTVYHDPGNVNFSFIWLNRKSNPVDFRSFTSPVIDFLKSIGLNAEFEGKSNIMIDGHKVSGNAAHVFKDRVLYHGTLLFNSDIVTLGHSILSAEEFYEDKSVRSVRKKVGNISELLSYQMTLNEFMNSFMSSMMKYFGQTVQSGLSDAERRMIINLSEIKYRKDKWNIGYSPAYRYVNSWTSDAGTFQLEMSTKEAVIEHITITGPKKHAGILKEMEILLAGQLHEKKSLFRHTKNLTFASENDQLVMNQILYHLF